MARRKISETELDAEELPELTAQQLAFVKGILDGKTATDAYRAAYDTATMADRTVWAESSRLRNNPDITAWITAARVACLGSARVTLDGHLQELERLKELALGSGNHGAAVQAEQLRGKAAGHYTERFEISTDADPLATLEQIASHSPELARKLAEDNGIPWQRTEH